MSKDQSFAVLPLVHGEHALGDEEAAEYVHCGNHQCDEAKCLGNAAAGSFKKRDAFDTDRQQCADDDHRAYRIGDRHQRRV